MPHSRMQRQLSRFSKDVVQRHEIKAVIEKLGWRYVLGRGRNGSWFEGGMTDPVALQRRPEPKKRLSLASVPAQKSIRSQSAVIAMLRNLSVLRERSSVIVTIKSRYSDASCRPPANRPGCGAQNHGPPVSRLTNIGMPATPAAVDAQSKPAVSAEESGSPGQGLAHFGPGSSGWPGSDFQPS